MPFITQLIQETSVTIPLEQLLKIDVSGFVEPYFEHYEYGGNKSKSISDIISSYAYTRLSKEDQQLTEPMKSKIEFNEWACIVHFAWTQFNWEEETT